MAYEGNETKQSALDEMVRIKLAPVIARLTDRAYEHVIDRVCKPNCGHGPDVKFCRQAEKVYDLFLSMHFEAYSGLN